MNRPAQPGWWGRNWKWAAPTGCLTIVMLTLLLLAFLAGGAIFAMFNGAKNMFIDSEPWQYASARAAGHPRVRASLGVPLEPSGIPNGSASIENADAKADFVIGVRGPKGSGKLYVEGSSEDGYWRYRRLEIVVASTGERIDLREPARIAPPRTEDPSEPPQQPSPQPWAQDEIGI